MFENRHYLMHMGLSVSIFGEIQKIWFLTLNPLSLHMFLEEKGNEGKINGAVIMNVKTHHRKHGGTY